MMFSSISTCVPDSTVTVSFISDRQQFLNISANITVAVNSIVVTNRPMVLADKDFVQATVISPLGYLGHQFYEYYLDGALQTFAVVNKNNYLPLVKQADAPKKWFNYSPPNFLISFYNNPTYIQRPMGFGCGFVDIAQTHVALDHINNSVRFYTTDQVLITCVVLPSGPIEYRKLHYIDAVSGNSVVEAVVLCTNKRLYRIRFDNQYFNSSTFEPTIIPIGTSNGLWFEQDLPSGKNFIDVRREAIRSKINPPMTALDISTDNNTIWIAGFDSIFVLSKTFQLLNQITISSGKLVSIACINNDAVATTRDGKVYYISRAGTVTLIYQTSVVGTPSSTSNGTTVAVPDPNNQRILFFNSNSGSYTVLATPDFAPAYAREFENKLWVTGHDTNRVLIISNNQYQTILFNDKVTLVSVVGASVLGIHYLQEFVTLDLTGIKKVLPFTVPSRCGPLSHIGTEPIRIKMLGEEGIAPIAGPGITCWINGRPGDVASTGDYLGISYKATANGVFQRAFIFGDTAFDYNIKVVSSAKPADYYANAAIAINRLNGSYNNYKEFPTVGNSSIGITGPINLGFDWNIYGNIYSQINVGTPGYMTFGTDTTLVHDWSFGNLMVDALHVESGNLYQGVPIDNRNPLNVGPMVLPSNQPAGVYYTTGRLDEFKFARIRWVGSVEQPYPFGNIIHCTTTISNTHDIPLTTLNGVNIGDYVSGTGITLPTTVTTTVNTATIYANVWAVRSGTNSLLIDANSAPSTDFVKYLTITDRTSHYTFLENIQVISIDQSTMPRGDKLIHVQDYTIIVDGLLDPRVDEDYTILLPIQANSGPITYQKQLDITSITPYNYTITCLSVISPSIFYISQLEFDTVYVRQMITASATILNATYITDKTIIAGNCQITTSANTSLSPGDTVNLQRTQITSLLQMPTVIGNNLAMYETVKFEIFRIYTTNTTGISVGNVSLKGKFATLSSNVSISANTAILFKTYQPVVEKSFEVGLYVGKSHQYLEYYYDEQSNHTSNTVVGVSSSIGSTDPNLNYTLTQNGFLGIGVQVTGVSTPLGRSIVFFSERTVGKWQYLGIGSFDYMSTGFNSYNRFEITRSIPAEPESDKHSRVEFLLEQEILKSGNIFISANFGYLAVNGALYSGSVPVEKNDIISLTVPFNNSYSAVAPIISIGDSQVSIPMISDAAPTPMNKIVQLFINQPAGVYVSANVIIPISDTFYIPAYYNSIGTSGTDIRYTLTRNSITTNISAGATYNFNAGDRIDIIDVKTPLGIYNTKEIDIISSTTVISTIWRNESGPIFDYLNFGTVIEPYTNNYEYIYGTSRGISYVDISPEVFKTPNIVLTSSTTVTGNLYIDLLFSNFAINGIVQGDYVTNVTTGDSVSLRRKFVNYLQGNINIYQVKYDTSISSNVYIKIGNWNVNQKIILPSDKLESTGEILSLSIAAPSSITDQSEIYSSLSSEFFQQLYNITGNISAKVESTQSTLPSQFNIVPTLLLSDNILPVDPPVITKEEPSALFNFKISQDTTTATTYTFGHITSNLLLATRLTQVESAQSTVSNGDMSMLVARINSFYNNGLYSVIPGTSTASFANTYTMLSVNSAAGILESTYSELESSPITANTINNGSYFTPPAAAAEFLPYDSDFLTLNASVSSIDPVFTEIYSTAPVATSDVIASLLQVNGSETELIRTDTFLSSNASTATTLKNSTFVNVSGYQSNLDLTTAYLTFNSVVEHDKIDSFVLAPYPAWNKDTIHSELVNIPIADADKTTSILNVQQSVSIDTIASESDSQNESVHIVEGSILKIQTIILAEIPTSEFAVLLKSESDINTTEIEKPLTPVVDSSQTEIEKPLTPVVDNSQTEIGKPLTPVVDSSQTEIEKPLTPVVDNSQTEIGKPLAPVVDSSQTEIEKPLAPLTDSSQTEIEKPLAPLTDRRQTEIEKPLPPVLDREPEYLKPLPPVLDREPEYLKPLPPVLDREPEYLKPLPPVLDREPEYLKPLPPVLDREPEYLKPLPPVLDREPEYLKPLPPVLDQDILWVMPDITKNGAYRTYLQMWANNGRGGDNGTMGPLPGTGTNLGNPPDYGPLLIYSKEYNYAPGGYLIFGSAEDQSVKYYSAGAIKIATTDYWNYRIYFKTRHFCVPKKGMLFPVKWYIRGG